MAIDFKNPWNYLAEMPADLSTEAAKIRAKIESGEAKNYIEAEKLAERGLKNQSLITLEKIAKVLGVKADDLIK